MVSSFEMFLHWNLKFAKDGIVPALGDEIRLKLYKKFILTNYCYSITNYMLQTYSQNLKMLTIT